MNLQPKYLGSCLVGSGAISEPETSPTLGPPARGTMLHRTLSDLLAYADVRPNALLIHPETWASQKVRIALHLAGATATVRTRIDPRVPLGVAILFQVDWLDGTA